MGDSNTVPVDRVRIFGRDGTPLAEFKASVSRSQVIGGEGRAQFDYPTRKTNVVSEDVIQFGNWLFVQNSAGFGWIGVIDVPRTWSTRTVTVSAYTPERVLSWRVGPPEEIITGSAGALFSKLIQKTNLAEQTVLRVGQVWTGGPQRQETLNPKKLSEYLRGIWERSGEEYTWTPSVGADGRLKVYGNWFRQLGTDTGILLHEGTGGGNVEAVGQLLVEDGPIVNSMFAYGEGQSWQSKPSVTAEKPSSIGRFGLRQDAKEYRGVITTSGLVENANQYLNEFRIPARTFALNALNVGDTFKYCNLGNIFNLSLQNAGFRGGKLGYTSRVRVIGMSYDPGIRNEVQLVVREVL